ncbi:hypothetical protein ALC53_05959 [Atta colombica]|uniref:Uncharacterized protein n=1 Tax=Atta colombica TaxID=520822 RepID=A0A195BHC9_9HYME|nr:hypothetical protein ALC53_05959 [Atta colombica]
MNSKGAFRGRHSSASENNSSCSMKHSMALISSKAQLRTETKTYETQSQKGATRIGGEQRAARQGGNSRKGGNARGSGRRVGREAAAYLHEPHHHASVMPYRTQLTRTPVTRNTCFVVCAFVRGGRAYACERVQVHGIDMATRGRAEERVPGCESCVPMIFLFGQRSGDRCVSPDARARGHGCSRPILVLDGP